MNIIEAITKSKICHAFFELISGDKNLAPNAREKKKIKLAKQAPKPKSRESSNLMETVPIRIKVSM